MRVLGVVALFCLLTASKANAQISGYSFRKQLTIDNTKVSGTADLIDFPALISVTDTDLRTILNGGDVTSDDGYDIAFTAADGTTILEHEIESFDPATGAYLAWVKIPTLSYNVDTDIYIYYGNASITSDPSSTDTWDSNYQSVWHLEESGNGTTGEYSDATPNDNHGKGGDGTASQVPTRTTGKIANAQDFDGADDWIKIAVPSGIGNAITLSAWVKHNALPSSQGRYLNLGNDVQIRHDGANGPDQLHFTIRDDGGGDNALRVNNHLNTTDWFYVVGTWDGTTQRLYSNGSELTSSTPGITLGTLVGNSTISQATETMDGLIDEARVSNIARSADWIATEYTNQNDPAGFLVSTGAEEPTSYPGNVSANLMIWLKANAGVLNPPGVTAWADQTGLSNAVAVASGDPQLIDEALSFNPVIDLDGTGDYFETITNSIIGGNSYTKIAVITSDNTSAASQIISSDASGNLEMSHTASGNIIATHNGTNKFAGGGSLTQGAASIAIVRYGPGGVSNYSRLDGVSTVETGNATFSDAGAMQIGAFNGAELLDGQIGEIVVCDAELSDADITRIESYLAVKYGITLNSAAGNYVASDGATTIWDVTANSAYHNDVAGIGRDDNTGLDQQKAISSSTDAVVIMDKGGSFGADLDYVLWGNDNGELSLTTADKHPSYDKRLVREWKVDLNGTPGTVDVSIIFSGVSDAITDYVLHVDSDGTFAAGTTDYASAGVSGDTVTFTNVAFSDGDYFTLGINQIGPGNVIDDLVLWLKADAGTSTTTDNTSVSTWTDQSGNGNTATTESGAREPTFKANSTDNINFNPTVEFDDVDDRMMVNLDALKDGGVYTVIAVGRRQDTDENYAIGSTTDGTDNHALHFGYQNSTTAMIGQGNNDYTRTVAALGTPDPPYILFGGMRSTGHFIRELRNNGIGEGSNTNTVGLGGTVQDWIGYHFSGSDLYYDGQISEIIAYNDELTATELDQLSTYLSIKYGTRFLGNYEASDGTPIWSTNFGYFNDMSIIGRDDGSSLYQKQSTTPDDSLQAYVGSLASSNAANAGTITNDISFIVLGHNDGALRGQTTDIPTGIYSRFSRVWEITNTNFTDDFSLRIDWDSIGNFDISHIRLLVDTDGTFSDTPSSTIFANGESGISISQGSIVIGGISSSIIPVGETRYITVGSSTSATPLLDITLPIELIDFNAQANPDDFTVALSWSTATETDNDFFTIERSYDSQDWEAVLRLPGAGNSQETITYEAMDSDPLPGISYYRLKQTDFDGATSYSQIEVADLGDQLSKTLMGYPNPATDVIYVHHAGDVTNLRVFDVAGRDLTPSVRLFKLETGELAIDISALEEGLYQIRIEEKSLRFRKR